MIARAILADPRDLAVHWVWLPLFHYLQVPLVALGGTMNDVRWANVVLSAAVPVVLFLYVRSTTRPAARAMSAGATALLAALLSAACPIAMQMGTTAQSEPLFALLALGIAIAFERRRYAAVAAMLGAAVVLRYEAWAIFATVIAFTVAEPLLRGRERRSGGRSLRSRRAGGSSWPCRPPSSSRGRPAPPRRRSMVRLPVADARVREPGGRGQRRRARRDRPRPRCALLPGLRRPARARPAVALAAFGVARTWRDQGARFVLVLAACLGFVSLTWVNRSSLGLDRHFVAIVPLYATFAAQGVAAIAERLERWVAARASERSAAGAGRAVAAALSIGSLTVLGVMLTVWMTFWRAAIDRGWPERVALGAYLRSLPRGPMIFCDDATLEILSSLDRRRFDRHWDRRPAHVGPHRRGGAGRRRRLCGHLAAQAGRARGRRRDRVPRERHTGGRRLGRGRPARPAGREPGCALGVR